MDPLTTSALVGAAATTASSALNFASTGSLNRQNRRWQEKMFALQNKEWQRRQEYMNEWNSAAAQRKRLEEAGLNPGLMYQGGASGTSGVSVPSPSGAPTPATSAPQVDASAIGAAFSRLPEAKLASSQADYYSSLADNENGVNRVLRQAQAGMYDALSALHVQEKDNLSVSEGILKFQRSLAEFDLKAVEQDWDYGQRLIEFVGPNGQTEIIPARMIPLYLDYANLVLAMLDSREGVTLFDENISNIRNQFKLISYSLPEALADSLFNFVRVGLLTNDKPEFSIPSADGKSSEKVTYRELLRRTLGAEIAEEFDGLVAMLNRTSRKNGWDKTFDVVDRVLTGSSAAASAYNGYRGTRMRPRFGGQSSQGRSFGGSVTEYGTPVYY